MPPTKQSGRGTTGAAFCPCPHKPTAPISPLLPTTPGFAVFFLTFSQADASWAQKVSWQSAICQLIQQIISLNKLMTAHRQWLQNLGGCRAEWLCWAGCLCPVLAPNLHKLRNLGTILSVSLAFWWLPGDWSMICSKKLCGKKGGNDVNKVDLRLLTAGKPKCQGWG